MPYPPLRNVEVIQTEHNGEPVFVLSDPEGFVEEQLILSPGALFVAAQFDGTKNSRAVQEVIAQETGGQTVPDELIQQVAGNLDAYGFLMSERFFELRDRLLREFDESDVRRPYLAGKSYPDDKEALRNFLDEMFREEGESLNSATLGTEPPLRCLIVPHIDFPRGAAAYAKGYGRLYRGGAAKTFFVFGVSHMQPAAPFNLTRKHFDTPFGTIETDTGLVDQLAEACAQDPFEYELVHRTEHSIEFQAVVLAYLFGTDIRIVPILCGGTGEADSPEALNGREDIARFLDACAGMVQAREDAAVIAGADLAHVGKRFGDPFDVDAEISRQIEEQDRKSLENVCAVNPLQWYASVMKDANQRRVCGLHCIYSALKTVEGLNSPGELLYYGNAEDPAGGLVSFTAAAI